MIIKKITLYILIIILALGLFDITVAVDEVDNIIDTELNQGTDSNTDNDENNENTNNTEDENITDNSININVEPNIQDSTQEETTPQQENTPTNNGYLIAPAISQVEDAQSNNANLSYLKLNIDGIYPEFDKNITEYYLVVDLDVEKLDIQAKTEDINATMTIEGNSNLKEGENLIHIIVKAEDNTTKTYTIYVTKTDNPESFKASLKTLEIKGFNLTPSFKPNIYNYNLMITEEISNLEIIAEPENANATLEIIGNENLDYGNNIIKIIVKLQDEEIDREYKINVYKSSTIQQNKETDMKEPIILISVLLVSIVIVSIILLKKRRH